jgi:hypothetical protein
MRGWRHWAMIGGGVFVLWPLVQPVQASSVMPNDYSYGEKAAYSTETRQEYLSRGQEFIRDYVRNELLKIMAANGVVVDNETLATGVSVDVKKYYADPSFPVDTQVRVYADQDFSHYQNSHFLPVEMEVASGCAFRENFKLHATVTAPWNKVASLNVGSEIIWNKEISSTMQYRLNNSSHAYDGFNVGLGFKLQDWQMTLSYDLTSDFAFFQHLRLSRNF